MVSTPPSYNLDAPEDAWHFWGAMLAPAPVIQMPEPNYYSHDDVNQSAMLWENHKDDIREIRLHRLRPWLLGIRSSPRWFGSPPISSAKPSEAYELLVKTGDLTFDARQAVIARRFLDKLHSRLDGYVLPVFEPKTKKSQAIQSEQEQEQTEEELVMVPRGLYVHGGVGTGKSMLLDLFYRGAQVQCKRRVHFNEFMLEVQTRLNQEKKRQLELYGRQRHIVLDESRDVVLQVAHSIADECHLLCFDEFQVTDVADALIMRKLFGVFFSRGVVIVATSNTPPQDLYKDGTNREYFLPFLDQLARHTRVVPMNSDVDYRFLCEPVGGEETFLSPLTTVTKQKMDAVYRDLLDDSNGDELLRIPVMMGRTLDVRGIAKSGVCRASFSLLCDTEKGAADYKAMAECFHTLVLDDVPALSMAQHDQARRFILLVDELYEHRTRLVLSSEASRPRGIFLFDDETVRAASEGANSPSSIEEEKQRVNKENAAVGVPTTSSWDAPVGAYGPSQTGLDIGNLVALKDLKVAFKRAVSRLREMQGERYLEENIRWRPTRAQKLQQVVRIIEEPLKK
ncbi:AFG1-like ATPase [Phytophthora citrophthora]|uniref:AFG1-like ATPase n=1 Tax=Phytophthora citrophthora TaxID=4793 RepID=A0AAD9LRH0_9STRA|nr:AFG1-like ATPase [Phytophthora citrophthora]